jgi:RNA polymerase sigma-70 factor (ECF subfamily)
VRDERPRFEVSEADSARLADAFQAGLMTGDLDALNRLLTEDAVFYSDGGGKKLASLNPIFGRDKIVRFFAGVATKHAPVTSIVRTTLNGLPGFVIRSSEGVETLALEVDGSSIVAIYAVRNPDKLRHLEAPD